MTEFINCHYFRKVILKELFSGTRTLGLAKGLLTLRQKMPKGAENRGQGSKAAVKYFSI